MPFADKSILNQILRESRHINDPVARKKFLRAAVETGIVESGGRNLPGGDADSQGWRQERASIYADPRNVPASVRRFRREFQQFYDPGEKAAEVAAQVQRPAAQYRGRYAQVSGEAKRILRGLGVQGGHPPNGNRNVLSETPSGSPDAAAGISSLLAQLAQPKPQIQSAGIAPPEFSASPAMPNGYQAPPSGGGPQKKPDIAGLLAAAQTVGGGTGGEMVDGVQPALTPPAPRGGGRGPAAALSWAESKVGFTEATGHNDGGVAGKLNRKFGMSNAPWCAMFTSAAVTRGGAPKSARTASVAEVRRKAQEKEGYTGFVDASRARAGDLILFGNSHIGMVRKVSGGKIYFVAGNHSNGVRLDTTPIGNGDIVRPQYRGGR